MGFCERCGNPTEDGQVCGCSGSGKTTAAETKPFLERVRAWPKLTRQSLAVISILIVVVVALGAIVPAISNAMADSQRSGLVKTTENSFKKMLSSALDGKSFESMKLSCTADSDDLEGIENAYDWLVSALQKQENGSGYKSVKITDFTDQGSKAVPDTDRPFSCELKVDYDYVRNNYDWGTEALVEDSASSTTTIYFTYVHEKGKWVLQRVSLGNW